MNNPQRRSCVDCGKVFTGSQRRCDPCSRPSRERVCTNCGKTFKGRGPRCTECSTSERTCVRCGKQFRGRSLACHACSIRSVERTCEGCGKTFNGHTRRCPACRRVKRTCTGCGEDFTGITLKCDRCRATERVCRECGETFTGLSSRCGPCAQSAWWESLSQEVRNSRKVRSRVRWKSLPAEVRRAQQARDRGARRARKRAAEVAGPVPLKVYEAIMASGSCVYCGDVATTVDHVRPLVQGGWEHESNLVPACKFCNFSKGPRLLTEWRSTKRVAYGIEHSPKVAAEYERLTSTAPAGEPATAPSRNVQGWAELSPGGSRDVKTGHLA